MDAWKEKIITVIEEMRKEYKKNEDVIGMNATITGKLDACDDLIKNIKKIK